MEVGVGKGKQQGKDWRGAHYIEYPNDPRPLLLFLVIRLTSSRIHCVIDSVGILRNPLERLPMVCGVVCVRYPKLLCGERWVFFLKQAQRKCYCWQRESAVKTIH